MTEAHPTHPGSVPVEKTPLPSVGGVGSRGSYWP
jgi:hypothetical protein